MSNKYAWVWSIKPECIEEYIAMHRNPWPEIMEAHRLAGIRNYSIFRNGNQCFYVFECDDIKSALRYIDQNADCRRWNAITSKMVEGSFDFSQPEPIRYLNEIFYLE